MQLPSFDSGLRDGVAKFVLKIRGYTSQVVCLYAALSVNQDLQSPVRTEVIAPIRNESFNKAGKAKRRVQGGNPRIENGLLTFDGSQDGNRQVDPQIAVGGGFVFHATNSGLVIFDKSGNYIDGVPQSEFNGGIDPKMFFSPAHRVFGFDLWNPWDDAKQKPVNISVSESADPRGAWNTYPVPAPNGVDGGGIGYNRDWIGYSFPGGEQRTFIMRIADAKRGRMATVYHFSGSLGHPVCVQNNGYDTLPFVELTAKEVVIRFVTSSAENTPVVSRVLRVPHTFRYSSPPQSPQPGTAARTASGDRNPKNLVVENGSLFFSHTVNVNGRGGIQWHEIRLDDGKIMQSGEIAHPTRSYIQTTLAVNRRSDVLIGFQEVGPDQFISARYALHAATDRPGSVRGIVRLREGEAATEGGAWGDYSGSVFDADNGIDLWTIQSFANRQGRGGTVIAKVRP